MARRRKTITTDEDLARLCRAELERSGGSDHLHSETNAIQREALNYYHARERNVIEKRSSAISSDVPDMVDALLAQIMTAFSGDNVAFFEPTGPDDESQAELESAVVNNEFMESSRGWIQLHNALKDALLLKFGVINVEAVTREVTTHRTVYGWTNDQLAALDQADDGQIDILERRENKDDATLTDADLKITREVTELEIRAVPAEDFRVHSAHDSIELEDCRFCAERVNMMTRSDLVRDGFSKELVWSLPATKGVHTLSTVKAARYQVGRIPDMDTIDPAQEEVETFICYAHVDRDGDGIAELLRIVYAGKRVLEAKEVDWVPYGAGAVILDPFRFEGISIHEKLKGIEDIKTQLLRQGVENVINANYPRNLAVRGAVEIDDLENPRPGGTVEVKNPDAVTPLIVPDMSEGIVAWMEYFDKVRSERGGAALDLQAAEAQLVGDTAAGVERQYQSRELRAALMAKTFAETLIRTVYLLVHRTLRHKMPGPRTIQHAGRWVTTDPSQWKQRDRVNVSVGLSPAERIRKKAALSTQLQLQAMAMQAGKDGELVNDAAMYQCAVDLGHASELENPEKYWIDPTSPEAQQAKQLKQQAAREQQEQLMAMQEGMARMQLQLQQMQEETDRAGHQVDVYKAQLDATTKIAIKIAEESGKAEEALAALETVAEPGGMNGGRPASEASAT